MYACSYSVNQCFVLGPSQFLTWQLLQCGLRYAHKFLVVKTWDTTDPWPWTWMLTEWYTCMMISSGCCHLCHAMLEKKNFVWPVLSLLIQLIIAVAGVLTGYNGSFEFKEPGQEYGEYPYVGMRAVGCFYFTSLLQLKWLSHPWLTTRCVQSWVWCWFHYHI